MLALQIKCLTMNNTDSCANQINNMRMEYATQVTDNMRMVENHRHISIVQIIDDFVKSTCEYLTTLSLASVQHRESIGFTTTTSKTLVTLHFGLSLQVSKQ